MGLSIESMVWMPSVAKPAVGAVAGSVQESLLGMKRCFLRERNDIIHLRF